MLKYTNTKSVELEDWDNLVQKTYGKPYSFQQQEDCRDRGSFAFSVPSKFTDEYQMNDSIPEKVNGDIMGVKFETWISRDPKQPLKDEKNNDQWAIDLFWERNFYPSIYTIANDLYSKGLIEDGDYSIEIDW